MPKKPKKILAVDDEAADLNLICNTLRQHDYAVLVAASYGDAINTFTMHQGEIDLLITDVSLPGKNGFELARDLLAINPGMKALFMSGSAGAEVCRFYNLPVTDPRFLEKPFSADELLNRVRKIGSRNVSVRTVGAE